MHKGLRGEAFIVWALALGLIVAGRAISPLVGKVTATACFLFLPLWGMRRRGEGSAELGLATSDWVPGLKQGLLVSLVVLPLYVLGWLALTRWGPGALRSQLPMSAFRPMLPGLAVAIDAFLVVALPEEFFYRGYIQTRLKTLWGGGLRMFGITVGPAFLLTQAMFALGHLVVFDVRRLVVFFPALIFGWMRERSGSVVGSAVFHACCNLAALSLFASW